MSSGLECVSQPGLIFEFLQVGKGDNGNAKGALGSEILGRATVRSSMLRLRVVRTMGPCNLVWYQGRVSISGSSLYR